MITTVIINFSWGNYVYSNGGTKINTIKINSEEVADFFKYQKHNIIISYFKAFFTRPLNQSSTLKIKEQYGLHQIERPSTSLINQGLIHPYNTLKIKTMDFFASIVRFVDQIFPTIKHTAFLYLTLMTLAVFITYKEKRSLSTDTIVTLSILSLGFIGYNVGILLVYIFVWDGFEATTLASFSRYLPMYLNGPLIFCIGLLLQQKFKSRLTLNLRKCLLFFIVLIIVLSTPRRLVDFYFLKAKPQATERTLTKKFSDMINTQNTQNFLILWPKSSVYSQYILRYELYPITNYIVSGLSNSLPVDKYKSEFTELFKQATDIFYINNNVSFNDSNFDELIYPEGFSKYSSQFDELTIFKRN